MIARDNIFQSREDWGTPLLSVFLWDTHKGSQPCLLSTDESLSIEPQGAFTNQPWQTRKSHLLAFCLKPDFTKSRQRTPSHPDWSVPEHREVRSEFSIHEDHSGIFSWLLIKYLSREAGKLSYLRWCSSRLFFNDPEEILTSSLRSYVFL